MGRGDWAAIARLVVLSLIAAAFIGGVVSSSSAAGTPLGTPWVATGERLDDALVSNGMSGTSEFNYFFDPTPGATGSGASGNWQFATTAG